MILSGVNTADVISGVFCYEAGLVGTTLFGLLVLRLLGYRMLAAK